MKKKRLINRILATSLALCFTASVLPLSSSAVVNAAQVKDNSIVAAGAEHILNASNNYDISKELIMPGESFRIEPQYEVFHTVGYYGQDVTNPRLYNASLSMGDVSIISKLVRNTADVSGIEPSINNTYNVIKMAYERGDLSAALEQMPEDPELREKLMQALQEALNKETTVTVGYVNNTNTPIVLQQVRSTSSKSDDVLYGGEYGNTPIVEAGSTHKSDCTIKFFEPYYTISYKDLLEGEEEGLPDRYYIQRESQTLVLPNLVRPGYHFDKWNGGMYFADQEKVGDTTVLTFDWENNLANASYNFGDETLFPTFKSGYTVTFNPNGGTIGGEESAIYELDKESESFFDIGDYTPEREGYTFLGWCYKPSAYYDSLIEDTSNYDWMKNTSGYDIQLYAKWAEESDIELETNGFRLNEETGELTIITDTGVKGWNDLCFDTDYECNAKVKSLYIGGDVTSVGSYDFFNCENLKSVVLSESVESINKSAFSGCSSLETIEMPGVTKILDNAFYDCTSLKTIKMPVVKKINSSAFENCTSLKTVEMPSVIDIYGNAFKNCSSLETVTIPPQTEYIGAQAFYKCSQLSKVVFEITDYDENEDYFSVSDNAFEECHPDLYILVQPSMLNLFKETLLPKYADIITDEVPVREITEVVINNATVNFKAGDKPIFTGTVPDGALYVIDYEGWFGADNEFISSSDYWNSAYVERNWCDGLISSFKTNTEYNYQLYLKLIDEAIEKGYVFGPNTKLKVNGKDVEYQHSGETSVALQIGTNLTITATETCEDGHKLQDVVTKATLSKNGSVVTKCTVCGEVKTESTIYYPKTITLSENSYTYNGKVKKPSVKVIGSNGKTISSGNYTVTYASGRKNVGKYAVKIAFKGNYSGTKTLYFTIKPKATKISKLTAGKKAFTAKWKKQVTQTTGYQIQYSTDKKFEKNNNTVTVPKNKTISKTVSKLEAKKNYYVRVCTYKTVKGTKYYSAWSKVKSVITKK
ncbi:MAG: leucine-rich repeat protein [Ruminococcus sp.]